MKGLLLRAIPFVMAMVLTVGGWMAFDLFHPRPAAAEGSDLETTLAQAAVKGFLLGLTRDTLSVSSTFDFYLTDEAAASDTAQDLKTLQTDVYQISGGAWLDDDTYQVTAILLPGNQRLQANVIKVMGRWRIADLALADNPSPASSNAPDASSTTAAPASTPAATSSARVIGPGLNVRSGPGVSHPVIAMLEGQQSVPILNRDPVSGWLQIQLPDGQTGWISGSPTYVQTINVATASTASGSGLGKLVFQTRSGGDIYVINANGTGLRRLTHGLDPVLSPDGRQVAFVRWSPDYQLFTINLDGTGEQARYSAHQIKSPAWSADGQRLAFNFQQGGQLQTIDDCVNLFEDPFFRLPERAINIDFDPKAGVLCYTVPPDAHWWLGEISLASGEYRALPGGRYSYGPSGHPTDANRLIYSGGAGLALLDVNSDRPQPITQDRDDRTPVISPDGGRIAVSYKQNGEHWEIHTMNVDGSNRRRLTETPLAVIVAGGRSWNNAAPAWSPDGSQIAFLTDRTGQWEIWLMNADGSQPRPMFPNGALDGLRLAYNGVDERALSWR